MTKVDVAVIGAGMIGSAAARHLAESAGTVALIGAGEPADWANPSSPFASHYDEARITRISAADPTWADLAARSIDRYTDIAARSGIDFHEPSGLVQAALDADAAVTSATERGGLARRVDGDWVREVAGIVMPAGTHQQVFYEDPPAGVVSPRRLVAAQTALAVQAGALLVNSPAMSVRRRRGEFDIVAGAERLSASRVLLATGAYGAELAGVDLAIERRLRTVVMAELDAVAALPCLIIEQPEQPEFERLYWTPPVRYPDGRMLLKIGGSASELRVADSHAEIAKWFASGGSNSEADGLLASLHRLLPDHEVRSVHHKPCVMTYTPTELPFVGFVDDDVAVALGGNGSAAKSSDELGRLAARTIAPTGPVLEPGALDPFSPILQ